MGCTEAPAPVLVLGGINMDILGTPHEKLLLRDSNPGRVCLRPGGVGRNIAWGMRKLGLRVELITAVGNDAFGAVLLDSCAREGIGMAHALRTNAASGAYLCLHDADGDMLCAINQMEVVEKISPARLAPLLPALRRAPLIVLDANLPRDTLAYIAEQTEAPLLLDPVSAAKAPRALPILPRLAAIKPNRLEAEALSGIDCTSPDGLCRAASWFLSRGVRRVYLSLGAGGVYYADMHEHGQLPIFTRQAANKADVTGADTTSADTTGAGDAMTAALAWGMLQGLSVHDCTRLGLAASAMRIADGTLDPNIITAMLLEASQAKEYR